MEHRIGNIGMAYVADFITGRAMSEKESAVGVVITRRTSGWPDPVIAAATDPVHAHEVFSPISLPLKGRINDQGYFEPNGNQLALTLLLKTFGFENWETFFRSSYSHGDGGIDIGGEKAGAGIAAMKPETFKKMIALGKRGQKAKDDPVAAARILVDAQRRCYENREDRVFFVALLANPPSDDTWTTLDGEDIPVPHCSLGLADGYPWELNSHARRFIQDMFRDVRNVPVEQTAKLFEALSDFQNLSRGVSNVGKYFAPGGFMRHDNSAAITDLNLMTLESAIVNAAKRDGTGVEWREERFLTDMEKLEARLSRLQHALRAEIEYAKDYLNPHDETEETPRSPAP